MSDWISVRERLPEHGLVVLGFYVRQLPQIERREPLPRSPIPRIRPLFITRYKKYCEIVMCYYWDGHDEQFCEKGWHVDRPEPKYRNPNITHWMPLPEPPVQQSKGEQG